MSAHVVRRYLREIQGGLAGLSDAGLLDRYVAGTDAEAFAELLHRHGPLVLATCRRILGHGPDSDDAFQGVFLILVRSARTIRRPASLAAWLHRTAIRAALRLRDRRHTVQEIPTAAAESSDPFADVAWRDLRRVLDEELDHLPETYRLPLVLCLLDGCTRDEAAERLACSLNTVKRRLDAGRKLLRARLLRRGIAPLVLAAVTLEGSGTRAAAPPELFAAILRQARQDHILPTPVRLFGPPASWRVAVTAVGVATVAAALSLAAFLPESSQDGSKSEQLRPTVTTPPDPEPAADPANVLPPGAVVQFGNLKYRVPDVIHATAQSMDGKLLAFSNIGSSVYVYDTAPWRLVHHFMVTPQVWSVRTPMLSFSQDGRYLAHLLGHQYAFIWDLQSGKQLHRLEPPGPANGRGQILEEFCRFTNDGLLAIAGVDKLFFYDLLSGREVRTIQVANVTHLSADGRFYVRRSDPDPSRNKWCLVLGDGRTGKDLPPLSDASPWKIVEESADEVEFAPDGKAIAVNHRGKELVELWDLESRKLVGTVPYPKGSKTGGGTTVGFTSDGRTLFLCLPNSDVARWDVRTLKELPQLTADPAPLFRGFGLHVLADGKTLLTPYNCGLLKAWDAGTGKEIPVADRYDERVIAALSGNGKVVAMADESGRIDVRDAANGKLLRTVRGPGGGAYRGYWPKEVAARKMALSAEGDILAYTDRAGVDRQVAVVRVDDGQPVRVFEEEAKESTFTLSPLGFSNDGRRLLLAYSKSVGGTVRWCDLATGEPGPRLLANGWLETLSSDGRVLADCKEGVVLLSDSATGGVLKRMTVNPRPTPPWSSMYLFAWSADGRVLVCAIEADYLVVIDPVGGRERTRFRANPGPRHEIRKLVGSGDDPSERQIQWIDLSPDGKWAVTTGYDSAGLWEIATGQRLAVFETGREPSKPLFTPDNRDLLIFGNGIGRRWNLFTLLAPNPEASPKELWEALNRSDAREAVRAANGLVATAAGRELLRGKVPAAKNDATEAQVKRWIAELANPEFATRESAEKELASRVRLWESTLREAAKTSEDQEPRDRLQRVLGSLDKGYAGHELRAVRLVHAAEMVDTRETVELMTEWSKGFGGAILTEDAKAALARMAKRGSVNRR